MIVAFRGVPRRADPPAAFTRFYSRRALSGTVAPSVVSAIAQAIQTQEGYTPGSVAYNNNNPGNLIFVGQTGATLGQGGFAKFPSYSAGYQALTAQITLDATRGTDAVGNPINNISDLIGSWAPASDPRNNTPAYIASVAAQTGFDANAPLSSLGDPAASYTGAASTDSASSADDGSGDYGTASISFTSYAAVGVAAFALVWLAIRD